MKNRIIAAITLGLGFTFAGAAMAQATSGSIVGNAKPGDVVLVSNEETSFTKEVKVKESGKYRIGNLTPGTFIVVVRHEDGSLDPAKQIRVNAGASARVQ